MPKIVKLNKSLDGPVEKVVNGVTYLNNIEVFSKGDMVHALLYASLNSEFLIPVKCIIEDVKVNKQKFNVIYRIKVVHFYDSIHTLRDLLYTPERFCINTKMVMKKLDTLSIPGPDKIKSSDDMSTFFREKTSTRFNIEDIYVFKSKKEMLEVYNKNSEFLITKYLNIIYKLTSNSNYKGPLKVKGLKEFQLRMKKGFVDTTPDYEEFKQFIYSLQYYNDNKYL